MITISDKKTFGSRESFTVNIAGVSISGCTYKAGTSAKGPYEFIAMPQHKITLKSGEDKWVGDVRLNKATADHALVAYKADKGMEQPNNEEPLFSDDDEIPF